MNRDVFHSVGYTSDGHLRLGCTSGLYCYQPCAPAYLPLAQQLRLATRYLPTCNIRMKLAVVRGGAVVSGAYTWPGRWRLGGVVAVELR